VTAPLNLLPHIHPNSPSLITPLVELKNEVRGDNREGNIWKSKGSKTQSNKTKSAFRL